MTLKKRILKICSIILVFAMIFQTVSCGTILYPERRNPPSTSGFDPNGRKIDLAVAFLDAVFLVFFIVPGIVAFAVDFATGAIYIPKGKRSSLDKNGNDNLVIYIPPEELNRETLKKVIFQETGMTVNFDDHSLQTCEMKGRDAVGFVMAGFDSAQLAFE